MAMVAITDGKTRRSRGRAAQGARRHAGRPSATAQVLLGDRHRDGRAGPLRRKPCHPERGPRRGRADLRRRTTPSVAIYWANLQVAFVRARSHATRPSPPPRKVAAIAEPGTRYAGLGVMYEAGVAVGDGQRSRGHPHVRDGRGSFAALATGGRSTRPSCTSASPPTTSTISAPPNGARCRPSDRGRLMFANQPGARLRHHDAGPHRARPSRRRRRPRPLFAGGHPGEPRQPRRQPGAGQPLNCLAQANRLAR